MTHQEEDLVACNFADNELNCGACWDDLNYTLKKTFLAGVEYARPRWISVKVKWPDSGQRIIALYDTPTDVLILNYRANDQNEFVAWMPAPELDTYG